MKLKKFIYIVYISVILLLLGFGAYREFSFRQFDNYLDKDIVITKVDKVTSKQGAYYTIVDAENNIYYFSTATESNIFDALHYKEITSKVKIKYNTRNNEISEVRNGSESDKRKLINWEAVTIISIIITSILLFFLLKIAIENEWFFRHNRSDIE